MTRRELLLINPTQWVEGRRRRGWSGNRSLPPLQLAYVAALTPPEWGIRIVDENVRPYVPGRLAARPDLVGLTSYTATIPRAYELAAHFRSQGVPVVIGGPHASAVPEEVLRYADIAFVGQAEGAWPQLLADFEQGSLRPLYEGGLPSWERLPLPRRDLYPHRYLFETVMTSVGCAYRCEFCTVWKTYGGRYHVRPVEDVLDELARMKARHLYFVDDNLTMDPRRTIELCQGMVERGLDKRFAVAASLEAGQNEEMLGWLAQAGCFLVCVGIESVDEETLRHLRKASNLKVGVRRFGEAIAGFHAHGIAVSAGIIFGNDADTLETFRQLEGFVAEEGVDSPVYTILTPVPGTDLWARLEDEGRLLACTLPEDYAFFDMHHVTYQPQRVTARELLAAKQAAVRHSTSFPALLGCLWRTWRRTGSLLGGLSAFQNGYWARVNARSSPAASRRFLDSVAP
jgi:radical SAM superfamily enzyme YgiQ (UPF0313 family)